MQPLELLKSYVAMQNECVDEGKGDFEKVLILFHPDAELAFDGLSFGPFRGWESIRDALELGGPSDKMDVMEVAWSGERVLATYAWRKRPGAAAGTLSLEGADGLITRLVIGVMDE